MSTADPNELLPRWLFVGFTGHRKLDHPQKVAEAIRAELNKLGLRNPRLAGVCSAASGADTLFAEAMRQRESPLQVVLPFHCPRFKQDFKNDPEGWSRSERIMEYAASIDIVDTASLDRPAMACDDPDAPLDDASADNQAYMEAGCRCVDGANVLLAVWDEREAKGLGGTGDVVRYAIGVGMPLIIINPVTGAVTAERLESIEPEKAGDVEPIDHPRAVALRYFDAVDNLAKAHAPWARQLIRWALWFELLAAVLGAGDACFGEQGSPGAAVSYFSLFLIVVAFILLWYRGKSYEKWLLHRAQTEVTRSFLATWEIRRRARVGHQPRPALPQLSGLFNRLRQLRDLDRSSHQPFEQARFDYEVNRIAHQLNYFRDAYKIASGRYAINRNLMAACTLGAVLSAIMVVICSQMKTAMLTHPNLPKLALFLAISLPLATTVLGLLVITDESSRRKTRYREMVQTLEYYEPRAKACRTWYSLARLATNVEEELLEEVLEWRSFVRHTEHLH